MNRDLTFCFGIVVSENDSAKFLKRSLNSILNQTELVQQIIILRNGDLNRLLNQCIEDFTKQSKAEVLILKQFESKRFGPNLNTLLNSTKCHYLIRQDPDDISVPSRVQEVFNFSQSNMFDVLFSNSINLDCESPMKFSNSRVYTQNKSLFEQLIKLNPIVHSSAVLNVKSILSIGGYRDLSKYEDYELWLRAIKNGLNFMHINRPTIIFTNIKTLSKRKTEISLKGETAIFSAKIQLNWHKFVSIVFWTSLRLFVKFIPVKILEVFNNKYRSSPLTEVESLNYLALVSKLN